MNQSKELFFKDEARLKLQKGVDTLAEAVKVTLGANGRNVIIDIEHGVPQITKDGVTVARSIDFEDPIENMGAQLVKDVAQRTNDMAGDGTTTATVLAQAILKQGMKHIIAGANPMDLKRGIDKAVKKIVAELKDMSKPVGDNVSTILSVATISANNDSEIGNYISQAIQAVSGDGVITIEEARGTDTTINIVDGMQYEKGYMSPYFVTDVVKLEVDFTNPFILLNNGNIQLVTQLIPIMSLVAETKRPLLIISDDLGIEVQNFLILNKIQGAIQVCACKAPAYGQARKDMMEDIAALTGGVVVFNDAGMKLENATLEHLGTCDKIVVTANNTTIIGSKGSKAAIDGRVEAIKYQIENSPTEYDKERYRERLAKLVGGVGVINVGGSSDVDMKERKDRFEDSLNATKAAIEEGIVPGGGVALLRAKDSLKGITGRNEDETLGIRIIQSAIQEPFRAILDNAGVSYEVVENEIKDADVDWGYNVYNEQYEFFFVTGIIDPVKVTRVALENAASISGLLLTTECVISIKPNNNKENV